MLKLPLRVSVVAALLLVGPILAPAGAQATAAPTFPQPNAASTSINPVYGMDVGLHFNASDDGSGTPSDAQITQMLSTLQGKTVWVRIFDISSHATEIAHAMGFKVATTAILSGDETSNQNAISQLETYVRNGWCQLAVVGSEEIHTGELTAQREIEYLRQVRSNLNGLAPVTTSETDRELLANPDVMANEDVVMANIPPVSYDPAIEHALTYVKSEYAKLGAVSGKQVIIGETEWPSDGAGWFFANPTWASLYFNDVNRWARVHSVPVFYFEAFDEPYLGQYNTLGAHWGVFTNDGTLKPGRSAGLVPFPQGHGYWLGARDGGIFPFGSAHGYGSTGGIRLNQPIVGMAATPDGGGYWLVASDGGIFPFGDAVGYGSTGNVRLNKPIVGMAASIDGLGYFLVASDGGIFPFGSAIGYGSTGNIRLNKPIVGMSIADGNGYWLVASDGGIFPFGDAVGYGSTGNVRLNKPIVGMAPAPDGGGYWLVASDGGIFPFGSAAGYGSTGGIHLNQPVIGMAIS